jgi:stage II sporulation protein D (peptidoglycan lytic transglycosylase)
MPWARWIGALIGIAIALGTAPALADDVVVLHPAPGTEFEIGGRSYGGVITLSQSGGSLTLTETTSVDQYLAGIKEVPFGWPEEALAAQVVAARTYLANTLRNGRSAQGRQHGFDICATSACQVYAGTGYRHEDHGDRWIAAVQRTAREILTFDGGPILAVYSSSAGSRTMAVQDVWGGEPLPYLQPVDSPEEGVSPFASWHVEIPAGAFVDILAADGYGVAGDLISIQHVVPPEGEGIARVVVTTTGGVATALGTDLKGAMNRHGPDLYPDLLPGTRADGQRKLPQALPSYNYRVSYVPPQRIPPLVLEHLPFADRSLLGMVVFDGEGWGHNLGMSQYGALAMALDGATYREILAHYYGGLTPVDAGASLPEEVVIGLGWDLDSVTLTATGPFTVGGKAAGPRSGGTWAVITRDGAVGIYPSMGYPTAPNPVTGRPAPV